MGEEWTFSEISEKQQKARHGTDGKWWQGSGKWKVSCSSHVTFIRMTLMNQYTNTNKGQTSSITNLLQVSDYAKF